jgi:hypothetical protein
MKIKGRRRIAILVHRDQRPEMIRTYGIAFLADIWRDDGLDVVFLRGIDDPVPADVIIVHVDLSVVPDEYLEFARQYPVALNGAVKDIRKSSFSRQRLTRESRYDGKVIVKSNFNHAGYPERALTVTGGSGRWRRWRGRLLGIPVFETPSDYRVYDRIQDLPRRCLDDHNVIVERFLPEVEDGRYHTRACHVLGDRVQCLRVASLEPIVNDHTQVHSEQVEPDPVILEMRRQLGIDYGKLDYVLHDGAAHLLDVNKTTGGSAKPDDLELQARYRYRAAGIYTYLS